MDENREDRLRRLMQATGEKTKAGAIDRAVAHYLSDLRNKRKVIDDLDPVLAEELSTPHLPLSVEIETRVGPEE